MNFKCLLLVLVAPLAALGISTSSISGTVTNSTGVPLPGIKVYGIAAGPQAAKPSLSIPINASTITDSGGNFVLPNLAPGAYNLCAVAVTPGQFSSCKVGTRPLVVSVAAGASQTGVKLLMGSGDVITINVSDTGGRLRAGGSLAIGFISDHGRYDFAKLVSQNGSAFQYKMTIPAGHTSYLVVVTPLAVKDAQGVAVVAGKKGVPLSGPTTVALTLP